MRRKSHRKALRAAIFAQGNALISVSLIFANASGIKDRLLLKKYRNGAERQPATALILRAAVGLKSL